MKRKNIRIQITKPKMTSANTTVTMIQRLHTNAIPKIATYLLDSLAKKLSVCVTTFHA